MRKHREDTRLDFYAQGYSSALTSVKKCFTMSFSVLRHYLPEGGLPPNRRPAAASEGSAMPQVQEQLQETLETSLHSACKFGDVAAISRLLDQGVDMNALSFRKCTPLFVATYYSQEDAALFLASKGCDVNMRDERRQTPVMLAVERGLKSLTRVLLENASLNVDQNEEISETTCDVSQTDERRRNVLHYVVSARNLDALAILQQKNLIQILSGLPDRTGRFPITLAARKGYLDVTSALLASGADPNVSHPRNPNAPSVLQEAVMHGRLHIVKLLLASGAQLQTPAAGDLCLVCACFLNVLHQERPDVLQVLVEAGASVNATSSEYNNFPPLRLAVEMAYFSMARMITLANCDLAANKGWFEEFKIRPGLSPEYIEFFTWLAEFMEAADKPDRLSYQCRDVIRSVVCYKQPVSLQVEQLPIPDKLRNFLLFRDLD